MWFFLFFCFFALLGVVPCLMTWQPCVFSFRKSWETFSAAFHLNFSEAHGFEKMAAVVGVESRSLGIGADTFERTSDAVARAYEDAIQVFALYGTLAKYFKETPSKHKKAG